MLVDDWRSRAWAALYDLAGDGEDFTADDLRDRVGEPDTEHSANGANNAIGSLFREAAAARLIVRTGRVTKSRQPHRKGGMIQVWRGLEPANSVTPTA